ncbi:MAG: alpha-glucosidase, partial [Acidobacteriota bacterium]
MGVMMKQHYEIILLFACLMFASCGAMDEGSRDVRVRFTNGLLLQSDHLTPGPGGGSDRALKIDEIFYGTGDGRVFLPEDFVETGESRNPREAQLKTSDGRTVTIAVTQTDTDFDIKMHANPDEDILNWGFSISATDDEYFSGLMERVVDGPQQVSWAPGIEAAMDLRGQKVEMIVKPTTSVYAPFYLSSRGYACFVEGTWPGAYDFCVQDPRKVKIQFEGPVFEFKIYTAEDPGRLIEAHAIDAGPPVLPPKWAYLPYRWRDEHVHLDRYYDGTPVTGPFNSQVMEDVLMMDAFGIPCGVYWVDRPYGPGRLGYDDFEIDPKRMPNFAPMVRWLNEKQMQMLLWIAPFFQG